MNAERMLAVADAIEAEEIAEFDMRYYFKGEFAKEVLNRWDHINHCGTSACIAGFTLLLYPPPKKCVELGTDINPYPFIWAQYILDLMYEEARLLFINSIELFADRPDFAATWLRDLAEGRKTFEDLKDLLGP